MPQIGVRGLGGTSDEKVLSFMYAPKVGTLSKGGAMEPKVEFKVRTSQVRWLEQASMSQNTSAGMRFWGAMCSTKVVRLNLVQLDWLINKLENKAAGHDDNQEYADRNSALRFRARCIKEFGKHAKWHAEYFSNYPDGSYEEGWEQYA
jgi:hypothetical protein